MSPSTLKKKKKVAIQDRAQQNQSSPEMDEGEDYGEESPGTTQLRNGMASESYGGEDES